MRIAFVTAHYPPDFISGATLQVRRLADEAAAAGHEVTVLTGSIRSGLADGEVRHESTGGVDVLWIGTASRIEQGDDGNWINPLAAAVAADLFDRLRPDVVHVHTLQTLGAGVLDAATSRGLRTVVTMHDLWWWCARLFLVDTSMRPCPLITDVDRCACARDAPWRAERARQLRRALDHVDEILVPSSSLRDVVLANGLDPRRVHVDENDVALDRTPVETALSDRSAPEEGTPVRFLFVGGDNPLKGIDTLLGAAKLLGVTEPWLLDAFGIDPGRVGTVTNVRPLPPYDPRDTADVMARHDVLIIPSLARESYSIAAREALALGLAVVSTDCLGPEEVVRDGVNGLIVPTGDERALAAAMQSLIHDRVLLASLRRGARSEPISLRTPGDHLTALVERYNAPRPVRRPTGAQRLTFVVGADGAIARYRVHHPAEALGMHDVSSDIVHYLDPALDDRSADAEVVVLQRVPATEMMLASIDRWRDRGTRVFFETDDLIIDPELIDEIPTIADRPAAERALYLDGLRRYRTTLDRCDGVIVSTRPLAEYVERVVGLPAEVVGNGLGLVDLALAERAREGRRKRRSDHVRVAYLSGSDSHSDDWAMIEPVIADVMRHHDNVELVLVGHVTPGEHLAGLRSRIRTIGFQPWWQLPRLLHGIDINLAPLRLPSRFNETKSAVKWVEAAAVGIPTIASDAPAFVEAIEPGISGELCGSLDDWHTSLVSLTTDADRRTRLGRTAHRRAMLHYGPHATALAYRSALDRLTRRDGEYERHPSITVAPFEQVPSAPALERYDVLDRINDGWLRRWLRRR